MLNEKNPYDNPDFRRWARRVRDKLVPMIKNSRAVVSLVNPDNVDAKFAVELGVAVMLDKPIIALVKPGTRIPEKLARVVDRFVEYDPDKLDAAADALTEVMAEMKQELTDREE